MLYNKSIDKFFSEESMLDFSTMIYRIPALLFAITIHEYAHAQCADSMGDPTARYMGRMTFNPMAHLDPLGAILLVVAGFGWAKPVEINPSNFRNRREGILKVSFAGPAANLFLCFLAAFFMTFLNRFGLLSDGVYRFLLWMQLYNVWFAFFNLIPVPPLDGSKILSELLPPSMAWKFDNGWTLRLLYSDCVGVHRYYRCDYQTACRWLHAAGKRYLGFSVLGHV